MESTRLEIYGPVIEAACLIITFIGLCLEIKENSDENDKNW